jgi:hypothetical protein
MLHDSPLAATTSPEIRVDFFLHYISDRHRVSDKWRAQLYQVRKLRRPTRPRLIVHRFDYFCHYRLRRLDTRAYLNKNTGLTGSNFDHTS